MPAQILYDLLERLFGAAVSLDIQLVQQLSGLKLDQCTLCRGAAAVYSEDHFGPLPYPRGELLAFLVHLVKRL